MIYILAFLLAITILVFFHELGHFWVARACGIRVLTFSIGFGPVLTSFKDKKGTQYQIAALPLGGYVRMLGEDEFAEQPNPAEAHEAFCNASPPKKIAIAAAGPLASLLLAWLVLFVVLLTGTRELDAYIGAVQPGSAAERAGLVVGDNIQSVDDKKTTTWQQVNYALANRLGDSGNIEIETSRRLHLIPIIDWLAEEEEPFPVSELGLAPATRPHIIEVVPDSPADKAGLMVGDQITAINSKTANLWSEVVDSVRSNPQTSLTLTVKRDSDTMSLSLYPDLIVTDDGQEIGQAGIRPSIGKHVRYGPIDSFTKSFTLTIDLISLSAVSIYKLIVGDVHVSNLGGPVRIAEYAGDFASLGLEPYLRLLAALTIALGLINLIPIPMLDGGHILYGVYEWILGRKVSYRAQAIGARVGLVLVASLMIFALYNDLSRLLG